MPAKKDIRRFNAFTKSYKLRYVVHAAEKDSERTICGRDVAQLSNVTYDEDAEGACKKCNQTLDIGRRIHPGFE